MFLQVLVSGLAVGSLYSLVAIGLVLIYKTSDVVNFAQGEMAMFVTFIAWDLLVKWHMPYVVSAILALIFAFFMGWLTYRLFLERLLQSSVLTQIIATLGLFLILRGIAGVVWGYNPISFPAVFSDKTVHFGNAVITHYQIAIILITAILTFSFYGMLRWTRFGLSVRAVAQNMFAARLMGVRTSSVFSFTWAVATLLGAVSGILLVPTLFLSPTFMELVTVKAFAAAVLGGIGSLPGAVIGGFALGVIENIFGFYVSTALKSTFVFLFIVVVLYLKPSGLFGAKKVDKV